jgi:hypothetical protein
MALNREQARFDATQKVFAKALVPSFVLSVGINYIIVSVRRVDDRSRSLSDLEGLSEESGDLVRKPVFRSQAT